jgi:hypothetical protein
LCKLSYGSSKMCVLKADAACSSGRNGKKCLAVM